MCDQKRPIYVDVSTHARDEQEKLRWPHRFPDAQTKHKQPDARQCKHKCSTADSKPRSLYSMLLATMPAAKKLPESLSRILENPTPSRLTSPWEKIYKIDSTLSSLMSRTIRKTLKPPLLVPLPEKTQATRQCEHKQTKFGIQLGGITSRKLNAELHKSP